MQHGIRSERFCQKSVRANGWQVRMLVTTYQHPWHMGGGWLVTYCPKHFRPCKARHRHVAEDDIRRLRERQGQSLRPIRSHDGPAVGAFDDGCEEISEDNF